MKKIALAAAAAALLWSVPSVASDKLSIAPPPAWVKIEPFPTDDAKSDGTALHILSVQQQMRLDPQAQTVFTQTVARIQTSEGLAAGTISLSWRPETEELTVHKVQILRGKQLIDVLAGGQSFTILRRETALEQATLDGTLTATLQPEGLQVGDILILASSLHSSDPVFKGHVEQATAALNAAPVDHSRLRIDWPAALKLRLAETEDVPPIKPVRDGERMTVAIAMDGVQPLIPPNHAPARFAIGRIVEATDFASWADLAALMKPYFDGASSIPKTGPLRAELDRVAAASTDPKARAEAALALVQQRVRYVALTMGAGGYVPAAADLTWSRRFGDCKGKTVLLLGLLHELGIKAEAVLVNAGIGDGIDQRLPAASVFNHVLVRATIAGKAYWLDGTRPYDTDLDRIEVPDFRWGLPLAAGATLIAIVPPPYAEPKAATTVRIDASAGIFAPAPFHGEMLLRGDGALGIKYGLANATPAQRDSGLKDYWRGIYDFVDIRAVSASYDEKSGTAKLVADGAAKLDWTNGDYQPDNVGVGYRADFTRQPGRHDDAPFAVPYPASSRVEETLLLPPGTFTIGHGDDVDQTVAGITYHRRARIVGQSFIVEKSERSVLPEFPAKDAPAAQATLRALAGRFIYVDPPSTYQPTAADKQTILTSTPDTAIAYIRRGIVRLEAGKVDDALADYDAAIAIEPGNVQALIRRAELVMKRGQFDEAARSIAAAIAVAPQSLFALNARAMLLVAQQKPAEAAAAFTAIIDKAPNNSWALERRAELHRQLNEPDLADADAKQVIALNPSAIGMYLLHANYLHGRAPAAEIAAVAAALQKANPDSDYAQVVAGRIYARSGRPADAAKAFDRALAIKPAAYIYLNRAETRPRTDHAGRHADLAAAIKLDPSSEGAIEAQAVLLDDENTYAAAIPSWTRLLPFHPKDGRILVARAIDYARSGQPALADRDFEAARAIDSSAASLNNICWAKATANLMLESGLADCEAAVAKAPADATILDSRAMILFRLGRFDDAIAAYDAALARNPRKAASLFGRGLSRAAKGDKANADADFTAAVAIDPDVEEEFAGYGLHRTGPFPSPSAPPRR